MHKLDRTVVPTPKCLSGLPPAKTWTALSSQKKTKIQEALASMQRSADSDGLLIVRCAYCEVKIAVPNPPDGTETDYETSHIEHFRTRNDRPDLTFDWSNLFLSCTAMHLCGKYKDHGHDFPYAPNDLIKPDVDDPQQYLRYSNTGEVLPRQGIDPDMHHRAIETIRVLRLNHPNLVQRREEVLSIVRDNLKDFTETPGVTEEDLDFYCREEAQAREWEPFSSAIKYVLAG